MYNQISIGYSEPGQERITSVLSVSPYQYQVDGEGSTVECPGQGSGGVRSHQLGRGETFLLSPGRTGAALFTLQYKYYYTSRTSLPPQAQSD